MDYYMVTVIIICFYLTIVLSESDLYQENATQDRLNPLNDYENADTSTRDQDKRTVFNSPNFGWAKHVGIKPSGHKYLLGYSTVDLKYTPVIRPLSVKYPGYVYGKPKVHFHIKRPVVQLRPARPVQNVAWKPALVTIKPVLPVYPHHPLVSKPSGVAHVEHVHIKPVNHVDHAHEAPHVDHVHNVPFHVDLVHPVHRYPVLAPSVSMPQAVPVSLPQPFVPVLPAPQFLPPPLFEVTKPNLGVLPLGGTFPSPILRNTPHAPAILPLPLKQAPVSSFDVSLPQPIPLPRPEVIPQIVPQPSVLAQPTYPSRTVVDFHEATNFINQIPVPQIPTNTVQPIASPHVHDHGSLQPAPHIPYEQHDVQTPVIPHHFIRQPLDQDLFQQQPPLNAPVHFQPQDFDNQNLFRQPLFQTEQNNKQFIQQLLPQETGPKYQPADQVSSQHFLQGSINGAQQDNLEQLDNIQDDGYTYQQASNPFRQHSVQPGETDLQLPLQLPQHPGFFQSVRHFPKNNIQAVSPQLQNAFRPSIQLEPPYKK